MKKTMIVWRRLGKEHGENSGYRVNTDEVVNQHLSAKLNKYRQTDETQWKWWQINENLLVETSEEADDEGEFTTYYYLPLKNWLVVENFSSRARQDGWKWYIHIGSMRYDEVRSCWVFTDWFSDVIVKTDNRSHSVLDLNEVAEGFDLELITKEELMEVLTSTQTLVDSIRNGSFPPVELEEWHNCERGIVL